VPFREGIGKTVAEVQTASRAEPLAIFKTCSHGGTRKVFVYGSNCDAEVGQKRVEIGNRFAPVAVLDPACHDSAGVDITPGIAVPLFEPGFRDADRPSCHLLFLPAERCRLLLLERTNVFVRAAP
jgi:hypothetical protein